MRSRTITATILTVLALTATACTSSDGDGGGGGKPAKPTAAASSSTSAAATPTVDEVTARKACISAWLKILDKPGDPDPADQPTVCEQVPGQAAAMYAEALKERNAANRKELDDCLDDPTCTEMPIP
jgi:hypothetical protein